MLHILPYFCVLVAAMMWGTVGTTQTFLEEGISPISVAAVRSSIGGGLLLVISLLMKKINFKKWSWKWTVLAALTIALFQCFFFTSVRFTGVAVGTVVTIGSSPVFSGFVEWIFWKRKPNRVWTIATALSIIGCALLFLTKDEATTIHPIGIVLALCAGCMFAFYTNCSKQLTEREETLPSVAMTFTLCAMMLLPFGKDGVGWVVSGENVWPMLFMGLVATSLAYILYLAGLEKISSSSAVTLSLAEPLTAAMLGVFLVGEYLSPLSWMGVALLLGGIIVLTIGSRKNIKNT